MFHLINRCVRRTYLCAKDRRTGNDNSHRKQWIRDRLEELRGKIPEDCVPILDRLNCSAETWLDFVENFRKRFRTVAGQSVARQSFRRLLRSRRQSPLAH